jgi:hypothetical protein
MIDIIIPFCSYDLNFIDRTIDGVRAVSDNIIITYCDHLFNGMNEDMGVVEQVISKNNDCNFISIQYDSDKSSRWHHNQARWAASKNIKSSHVLFLDSDEVFESDRFYEWMKSKKTLADVTTFANYWYFRSEKYQAKTYEDSPVLVNTRFINKTLSFDDAERAVYKNIPSNNKELNAMGLDGNPMCHHYSWALNKEDMLKKVRSWGHKNDKNWEELIEEEFSRDFNGKDFVHGFEYNILK